MVCPDRGLGQILSFQRRLMAQQQAGQKEQEPSLVQVRCALVERLASLVILLVKQLEHPPEVGERVHPLKLAQG